MPRPLFPPRFALASVAVLRDPNISHAEFRFYAMLRALSWGEDTLKINLDELIIATGYCQASVYAHARALRLHNALLWHCAEDVFECVFTKPTDDDNFFSPIPGDLESLISIRSQTKIPERKKKNSDSSSSGIEPKATVTQVCEAYKRLLGYEPASLAKGETKAAKWLGERYTLAELEEAYTYYKAMPFWHDKPLTLRQLQNLLPEYLLAKEQAKGRAYAAPLQPDDPGQLERDLKLKAERSERRERREPNALG